jgi:predicted nucleic acid-binding protein
VYVDSNIFISALIYQDARRASDCAQVLRAIEGEKVAAYTSTLTWDEVVWVVSRFLGKADSVQAGEKLIGFPNLRFVPVTEDVLRSAQKLLEGGGLAPRDAVHIASAVSRRADFIVSDDKALEAVEGTKRLSSSSFVSKRGGQRFSPIRESAGRSRSPR